MLDKITPTTFLRDRNQKIREAISAGYDKDYITKCVYEQQSSREPEHRLSRAECKQLVYGIAFEVYRDNLRAAGCIRS
jgi:ABC-type oligopeptide transport system substrate-binding subunit